DRRSSATSRVYLFVSNSYAFIISAGATRDRVQLISIDRHSGALVHRGEPGVDLFVDVDECFLYLVDRHPQIQSKGYWEGVCLAGYIPFASKAVLLLVKGAHVVGVLGGQHEVMQCEHIDTVVIPLLTPFHTLAAPGPVHEVEQSSEKEREREVFNEESQFGAQPRQTERERDRADTARDRVPSEREHHTTGDEQREREKEREAQDQYLCHLKIFLESYAHSLYFCETLDLTRQFPSMSAVDNPAAAFCWNHSLTVALRRCGLPHLAPPLLLGSVSVSVAQCPGSERDRERERLEVEGGNDSAPSVVWMFSRLAVTHPYLSDREGIDPVSGGCTMETEIEVVMEQRLSVPLTPPSVESERETCPEDEIETRGDGDGPLECSNLREVDEACTPSRPTVSTPRGDRDSGEGADIDAAFSSPSPCSESDRDTVVATPIAPLSQKAREERDKQRERERDGDYRFGRNPPTEDTSMDQYWFASHIVRTGGNPVVHSSPSQTEADDALYRYWSSYSDRYTKGVYTPRPGTSPLSPCVCAPSVHCINLLSHRGTSVHCQSNTQVLETIGRGLLDMSVRLGLPVSVSDASIDTPDVEDHLSEAIQRLWTCLQGVVQSTPDLSVPIPCSEPSNSRGGNVDSGVYTCGVMTISRRHSPLPEGERERDFDAYEDSMGGSVSLSVSGEGERETIVTKVQLSKRQTKVIRFLADDSGHLDVSLFLLGTQVLSDMHDCLSRHVRGGTQGERGREGEGVANTPWRLLPKVAKLSASHGNDAGNQSGVSILDGQQEVYTVCGQDGTPTCLSDYDDVLKQVRYSMPCPLVHALASAYQQHMDACSVFRGDPDPWCNRVIEGYTPSEKLPPTRHRQRHRRMVASFHHSLNEDVFGAMSGRHLIANPYLSTLFSGPSERGRVGRVRGADKKRERKASSVSAIQPRGHSAPSESLVQLCTCSQTVSLTQSEMDRESPAERQRREEREVEREREKRQQRNNTVELAASRRPVPLPSVQLSCHVRGSASETCATDVPTVRGRTDIPGSTDALDSIDSIHVRATRNGTEEEQSASEGEGEGEGVESRPPVCEGDSDTYMEETVLALPSPSSLAYLSLSLPVCPSLSGSLPVPLPLSVAVETGPSLESLSSVLLATPLPALAPGDAPLVSDAEMERERLRVERRERDNLQRGGVSGFVLNESLTDMSSLLPVGRERERERDIVMPVNALGAGHSVRQEREDRGEYGLSRPSMPMSAQNSPGVSFRQPMSLGDSMLDEGRDRERDTTSFYGSRERERERDRQSTDSMRVSVCIPLSASYDRSVTFRGTRTVPEEVVSVRGAVSGTSSLGRHRHSIEGSADIEKVQRLESEVEALCAFTTEQVQRQRQSPRERQEEDTRGSVVYLQEDPLVSVVKVTIKYQASACPEAHPGTDHHPGLKATLYGYPLSHMHIVTASDVLATEGTKHGLYLPARVSVGTGSYADGGIDRDADMTSLYLSAILSRQRKQREREAEGEATDRDLHSTRLSGRGGRAKYPSTPGGESGVSTLPPRSSRHKAQPHTHTPHTHTPHTNRRGMPVSLPVSSPSPAQ
ncbi:hypothetical protein KIPB_006008, partial [Kipferlia bialata]